MNQRLKQLVEKHIEKIDNEDFSEVFEEAIKEGVCEELLDLFHSANGFGAARRSRQGSVRFVRREIFG